MDAVNVQEESRINRDDILKFINENPVSLFAMYVCHRYGGGKLKEIGKSLGIGDTVVSQAITRLHAELKKNKKLGDLLERVRVELNLLSLSLRP